MKITKNLIITAQKIVLESDSSSKEKLNDVLQLEKLKNVVKYHGSTDQNGIKFLNEQEGAVVAGSFLAWTTLIALLVAAGERWFKYYSIKCYDVADENDRRLCKFDAKIQAHKHEIAEANRLMKSSCQKTKDPDRCKMRMKKAIVSFQKEIDRLEYLKKKGKLDIASAIGNQGYHPSLRFPMSSRSSGLE